MTRPAALPSRGRGLIWAAATQGTPTTNPAQFISQVRAEAAKIVWPTRREVVTTTIMVFVMAALFSMFFFLVDLLIRWGVTTVLTAVG